MHMSDDSYIPKSKQDFFKIINQMIVTIQELPPHAMTSPVTHYDYLSLLMLISSLTACDIESGNNKDIADISP